MLPWELDRHLKEVQRKRKDRSTNTEDDDGADYDDGTWAEGDVPDAWK